MASDCEWGDFVLDCLFDTHHFFFHLAFWVQTHFVKMADRFANLSISEQLSFLRARDLVYVKWCDMLEEWLSGQWDWMYQLELRLQSLEKSMKTMKAMKAKKATKTMK